MVIRFLPELVEPFQKEFHQVTVGQIPSDGENDRTDTVTPVGRGFLFRVLSGERQGHVFNPNLYRGVCRKLDTVSRTISR